MYIFIYRYFYICFICPNESWNCNWFSPTSGNSSWKLCNLATLCLSSCSDNNCYSILSFGILTFKFPTPVIWLNKSFIFLLTQFTVIKLLLIVISSGLTFCWLGVLGLAYYCIEIPVVFSLVTFTRDEIGLFCCRQFWFVKLTFFILWNFWKSSPSPGAPPNRNIKR